MNKVFLFGIIVLIIYCLIKFFGVEYFSGDLCYLPKNCNECAINENKKCII